MQYFLYSQITTDRHQIFIARRPLMEKSLRSRVEYWCEKASLVGTATTPKIIRFQHHEEHELLPSHCDTSCSKVIWQFTLTRHYYLIHYCTASSGSFANTLDIDLCTTLDLEINQT